jgi:hypothetical protein
LKRGTKVRLHIHDEKAIVHMFEDIQISKELKEGNELMVSEIWMCEPEAEKVQIGLEAIHPAQQPVLHRFLLVFEQPTSLPPKRKVDHKKPLIPNYKSIKLRPYRYSYF